MSERESDDPFPTPELSALDSGGRVPEQVAYLDIVRTAQALGQGLRELFEAEGLSGKQYNALRAVRRAGAMGATSGEVGRQMTDRRADVTRLLDRLVRDGLVERRADPSDRRVVRVVLTPRGTEVLARLDGPVIDLHRRQLGHMAEAELDQLSRLLRRARGEVAG